MCQNSLRVDCLESSFVQNDLRVLVTGGEQVDPESTKHISSIEGQEHTVLHKEKHCQQTQGSSPSSLLSPGKTTAGALGPVLSSMIQENHGRTGASPVQDNED